MKYNLGSHELWLILEQFNQDILSNKHYCNDVSLNASFPSVLMIKDTAVKFVLGDIKAVWVHANNVTMKDHCNYVIAQHPGREYAAEFWEMCLQNNVNIVIDLTQKKEVRTDPYYPITKGIVDFYDLFYNKVQVTTTDQPLVLEDYTLYKLTVVNSNNVIKDFIRIYYHEWPDFNIIDIKKALNLISDVDALVADQSEKICVHCRGGVGRSGTFIALRTLKNLIASGDIHPDNFEDKLVEIVEDLRIQRGPLAVMTEGQFTMLYHAAQYLLQGQ